MGLTPQAARRESARTGGEHEELWDGHGGAAYALACALCGNESVAAEAVGRAIADLSGSIDGVSTEEVQRRLVRQVHLHAQVVVDEVVGGVALPPVIAWVSRFARLQRASLALCVFGGLTHREAAVLLGVPPSTVADLLRAGLRELWCHPTGTAAIPT